MRFFRIFWHFSIFKRRMKLTFLCLDNVQLSSQNCLSSEYAFAKVIINYAWLHILISLNNSYREIIYILNYQNVIYNNHLVEFKDLCTQDDIFILWWNSKILNSKGLCTKYGNNVELHIKAGGGSGVNFACLAHMKVPFIAEQPLFTERRYHAVSKSYWTLKISRWTISL